MIQKRPPQIFCLIFFEIIVQGKWITLLKVEKFVKLASTSDRNISIDKLHIASEAGVGPDEIEAFHQNATNNSINILPAIERYQAYTNMNNNNYNNTSCYPHDG